MKTEPKLFWLVAIVGSVALHVLALFGIAFLVAPDSLDPQDMPKSQIDIKTQDVEQVEAEEAKTIPETASESTPQSKTLGQGAFAKSKAQEVQAGGTSVRSQTVKAQRTQPSDVPTNKTPTVAPKTAQLAVVQPQETAGLSKSPPTTAILSTQVPARPTELLEGNAEEGLATAPTGEIAVTTAPSEQATPSASVALPAERGQASLAWSGGDDAVVEAASLSAIQAFMQPSDLLQSGGAHTEARDGIAAILSSIPCSRLQVTFLPESGRLELRGHIPEDALRGPVLAALQNQIGDAIPITDQILILPRPQCGALSGIADIGLPQSTEQLTNPRVIGASGFAQNYTYFAGQRLSLELVAPDYDSFVYVDFFTADGMVIHLQPNEVVPLEFSQAKTLLYVGKELEGKPSLELTIGPPYGQEIAAAFASSVRLYEDPRPLQETADSYLAFLKAQVAEARLTHDDYKGEWVYFFISTADQ